MYARAYKLASLFIMGAGRGECLQENAHWDCSLSSSYGKQFWHRSQVREIKGPSGRKEEGIEGQLATYGVRASLPKASLFGNTWTLPLGSSRLRST